MIANREDLAIIMTLEQGKPLAEARGEIDYSASFVEWFAEEAKRVYGSTIPSNRPEQRLSVLRQPVGVVAAITPWNFPNQINLAKVGPALAAGNTVVLKPAPDTGWLACELGRLAATHTDLPPGVLNVVTPRDDAVAAILTTDPDVDLVSFTGSTATGRAIMAAAAPTLKRVFLELGGKSAAIVLDDADLAGAVGAVAFAVSIHAGQGCALTTRPSSGVAPCASSSCPGAGAASPCSTTSCTGARFTGFGGVLPLSAVRTATSRARPAPCTSNRLAALTQATARTRATAPINAYSAGRTGPRTTSSSGSTNTPRASLDAG